MTRYFGAHTLEGEWHSLLPRYALLAPRVGDKQVLDVGCGTGIGSSLMLEMGAKSVNAIDHRPEVLELARLKHAKQGLNFNCMFWEELDFPDDTFDIVTCLDPNSPVTDPNLLSQVRRVLRPGGEYICAIERRNLTGLESLLPRYGYANTGEEIDLAGPADRVPQIGNLDEYFTTIISIVQRPRYSFIFDYPIDPEAQGEQRKLDRDESGIWVGDDPKAEEGSAEQTDQRAGRWIEVDRRLCGGDGESAAVELLFCGDETLRAPALREVQLPFGGLVDRLHQLFSDLQLRQHPDQFSTQHRESGQFRERTPTSEFRPLSPRNEMNYEADVVDRETTGVHLTEQSGGLRQLRNQLDQMTQLYEQVRTEVQDLFYETRRELAQRDRYIEQLVDTLHRWRQPPAGAPTTERVQPAETSSASDEVNEFEREPTAIFRRSPLPPAEEAQGSEGVDTDTSPDAPESAEEMSLEDPPSGDEPGSSPEIALKPEGEGAQEEEANLDAITDPAPGDDEPEEQEKERD